MAFSTSAVAGCCARGAARSRVNSAILALRVAIVSLTPFPPGHPDVRQRLEWLLDQSNSLPTLHHGIGACSSACCPGEDGRRSMVACDVLGITASLNPA